MANHESSHYPLDTDDMMTHTYAFGASSRKFQDTGEICESRLIILRLTCSISPTLPRVSGRNCLWCGTGHSFVDLSALTVRDLARDIRSKVPLRCSVISVAAQVHRPCYSIVCERPFPPDFARSDLNR